eukprot:9701332-Lingulodinium_polyedra.AAC.1
MCSSACLGRIQTRTTANRARVGRACASFDERAVSARFALPRVALHRVYDRSVVRYSSGCVCVCPRLFAC